MKMLRNKQNIKRIFSLNPFVPSFVSGAGVSLGMAIATGIGGLVAGPVGGFLGVVIGFVGSGCGILSIESVRRNFRVIPFALAVGTGVTAVVQLGEHVGARKPHAPAVAARSVTIPYGPVQTATMQLRCQRPLTLKV